MDQKREYDEVVYNIDDSVIEWEVNQRIARQTHSLRLWSTCNFVATVSNLAFFVLVILAWSPSCGEESSILPRLPWHAFTAPATRSELRAFEIKHDDFTGSGSKYTGPPRPELDDAWSALLNGYNLRVPKHVSIPTSQADRSPVEVPDGSGDRHAVLAVFHELDCLKTMREYMLPDYYPQTHQIYRPLPGEALGAHIDRCFDVLRQSAMCRADTTLLPMEYDESSTPQLALHSTHQCANWDVLQAWAAEHSLESNEKGVVTQYARAR